MARINVLKPDRLDIDINSNSAAKLWKHWKRTFDNFVNKIDLERNEGEAATDRLELLTNFLTADIFQFIENCSNYDDAEKVLQNLFIRKPNEIFSRHLLATRKQQTGESVNEFMQALQILSKNCECKPITAENYRKELCRDAFINGLTSSTIRQRLLENNSLTLEEAFNQANALDMAIKHASAYNTSLSTVATTSRHSTQRDVENNSACNENSTSTAPNPRNEYACTINRKCYFCGYDYHKRDVCPARNLTCNKCGKLGHFMKVCKSKSKTLAFSTPTSASICAHCPATLSLATVRITAQNKELCALIDSGSAENYMSKTSVDLLQLPITPAEQEVSMAQSNLKCHIVGLCTTDIIVNDQKYERVSFGVMEYLCSDVILGQTFQKLHNRLVIEYGGSKNDLIILKPKVCALTEALISKETLFPSLPAKCRPIAVKSRNYS